MNNNKIKIAIVGIGGCASSLVQGLEYYKNIVDNEKKISGLMHPVLGKYKISDISIVAAFDIDRRKVERSLGRAIFVEPNCTKNIWKEYQFSNDVNEVIVQKSPVLDGVADHMKSFFQVDKNQKELTKEEIISLLKKSECKIIISYLPVGSRIATEFWAEIALEAGVGFINCIPEFVASDSEWANKFKEKGIPIMGDDIKSQIGSTITSRYITQMLIDRGVKIDSIYQTNFGGNTDFLNMISQERLKSKKISKTESISSLLPDNDKNNDKTFVYAGPNGYIECLKDNKISHMRFDFKIFGEISCSLDCKLSVEDSPNSAGIVVDAIRIMRLALDRKIGGVLIGPSAWLFKHPLEQYSDNIALDMTEKFIKE